VNVRQFQLLLLWATGVTTMRFAGELSAQSESAAIHVARGVSKPRPWPGGIVPYDVSQLNTAQQEKVALAMKRWEDTGANIRFVLRSNQTEHVFFTGKTDAGNNASHTGFKRGVRTEINITSFWWRQAEWMPAHELGHALGFHHEHQRWDRDAHVTIHYQSIKEGRSHDYDWIPRTNWLVTSTPYDVRSIMHYRVCWTSACETNCKDGRGESPCAVIDPHGTEFDSVIGQWDANGISAIDAEELRLIYGVRDDAAKSRQ